VLYISGRTIDGGCFPLCLWITKSDGVDNVPWTSAKYKDRNVLEVNIRVSKLIHSVFFYYTQNVKKKGENIFLYFLHLFILFNNLQVVFK
jgi:hypothetical protein